MAPAPIDPIIPIANTKAPPKPKQDLDITAPARQRLENASIDLSEGFIQGPLRGARARGADPARRQVKKALLGPAAQVVDLTTYVGTEIEGLQLGDLTDRQRDELALLVAERSVQQLNLGKHFGEVEVHPQVPYVPGLPGVHIIWPNLQAMQSPALFRRPGGASRWHSDLVH
ncbi:hypothetical protein MCOR31_003585 [Pyricularia oryzae]|nr:hypothetical protein MCOR26_000598 [Pyricularia oryzae]KAI6321390.1 hypothetical protein MCOR34_002591 [Pyricularia oryzae]KAI6372593.1 hypothetical protein MCOR31_003585 [Pyricularia oryzae]KAI6383465.1 hypothetical protein MCOR32_002799 [Pyricularia oryzae]KAI6407781.1 hypothetical protein MCOR23_001616 [Pyricularia oryzae]